MPQNQLPTLPPLDAPPLPELPPLDEPDTGAAAASADASIELEATPHEARTVAVQVPAFRPALEPRAAATPAAADPAPAAFAAVTSALRTPARSARRPATPPPLPVEAKRPATPPPLPPASPVSPEPPPAIATKKVDPPSVAPPAPPTAARPPLPWAPPAATKRRALPKKAQAVLIVAGVLVALLVVTQQFARSRHEPPPRLALKSDPIVTTEELKTRREVSPDNFVTADPAATNWAARAQRAEAQPATPSTADLDARRAHRDANPDDLHPNSRRGLPRPGPGTSGPHRPTRAAAADDEESLLVRPTSVPGAAARDATPGHESRKTVVLAAAGTQLPVVLATPVQLTAGSAETVVVTIEGKGELRDARFVGVASASASGGRVSVRFRKLLLADGREISVSGEAQDQDGGFGLAVAWPASSQPSVGREVATETATETVLDAVGGGVLGTAARKYNDKSRPGPASDRPTVTLPAGQSFTVFLHESAQE